MTFLSSDSSTERLSTTAKTIIQVLLSSGLRLAKWLFNDKSFLGALPYLEVTDMLISILKIDSSCSATWTLQKMTRDNDVVNENIIDQINRNFDMDDFFKFRFQYRKIVNYR